MEEKCFYLHLNIDELSVKICCKKICFHKSIKASCMIFISLFPLNEKFLKTEIKKYLRQSISQNSFPSYLLSDFIAQFDFKWEIAFPSNTFPLLAWKTWHLRQKSSLDENVKHFFSRWALPELLKNFLQNRFKDSSGEWAWNVHFSKFFKVKKSEWN